MNEKIETTPQELMMLIGEREVIKYKQGVEIQRLYTQIDEMAKTISDLRLEIVKLKEPPLDELKRG